MSGAIESMGVSAPSARGPVGDEGDGAVEVVEHRSDVRVAACDSARVPTGSLPLVDEVNIRVALIR